MKVLLMQDVYKLGHAGDVKKVADGYGRNFLLPQGLAVLATPGALKSIERIRVKASATRELLNTELKGVAEKIQGMVLTYTTKAGETGKLYGSITTAEIAEDITKQIGANIDRRQIESQPIRTVGEHKARIRLTIDLVPEVKIIVQREGEKEEAEKAEKAEKAAKTKRAPRKSTKKEEVKPEDNGEKKESTEEKPEESKE
jgi:large subunit ribosomal protein L9